MLLEIMSALHDIDLTINGMLRFILDLEHCLASPSMSPNIAKRRSLSDI